MADALAVLNVEIETEVVKLACDCGDFRRHAPYIDGQNRRNFFRRVRARLLRRPLVNVPCPTPRVTRQVVIQTQQMTADQYRRLTGG